jgi:predicted ATPase
MISKLAVSGYRSLRDIKISLGQINIVTGANGSGKSSLYRALRLIADVSQGRVIQSLASEGGLPSTLWAGPEAISRAMKQGTHPIQGTVRSKAVALKLGFSGEDYGYAIDLGLPVPSPPSAPSHFLLDPIIKVESIWNGNILGRNNCFAERRGPLVRIRTDAGAWRDSFQKLADFDSMMTHYADPDDGFELLLLRERMKAWRFYDQLRTDREAPARRPQIGTYTPVLASDGLDLAAAIQTIREFGNSSDLDTVIDDAFPGSEVRIANIDGYFEIEMRQHGLLRPLKAAELSEGTLRYVLLVAALLSPRPPELMILNEPEVSLHPDLFAPLARLIARSSEHSQIILVSHAPGLVAALHDHVSMTKVTLEKEFGETHIRENDAPSWVWPSR